MIKNCFLARTIKESFALNRMGSADECSMSVPSVCVSDKVVCYYGSWATYRVSNGKYDVEDINPNLCTHIIYSFVGLDASTNLVKILDTWNDVTLRESSSNGDETALTIFFIALSRGIPAICRIEVEKS